MKTDVTFDEENFDNVYTYARGFAGNAYSDALEVVLTTALSDKRNLPSLRYPKKINGVEQEIPLKDYIKKWVSKFLNGYNGRPSVKTGNKSATFSDPIIKLGMSYRLPDLSDEDLVKIVEGHSIQMSLENLVGELLEEYLSIELGKLGWYCCWGSSIDAVDFCNEDGDLLQVKNSDNSENSSSSRVRNGTEIKKWYRRKSTKKETFCWDKIIDIVGECDLSELGFREFVKLVMESNPSCLYIEGKDNPDLFSNGI
jgi:hypothetical protein